MLLIIKKCVHNTIYFLNLDKFHFIIWVTLLYGRYISLFIQLLECSVSQLMGFFIDHQLRLK